jgi:hypothetical protein
VVRRRARRSASSESRAEVAAERNARVPLRGGMGAVWDVANAALFLAWDEADFIRRGSADARSGETGRISRDLAEAGSGRQKTLGDRAVLRILLVVVFVLVVLSFFGGYTGYVPSHFGYGGSGIGLVLLIVLLVLLFR